jgi:hypothetical protein
MKAREAVVAQIDLRIAGHSISSVEVLPLPAEADLGSAIERALSAALDSTAAKVDAMKFWERKE